MHVHIRVVYCYASQASTQLILHFSQDPAVDNALVKN